MRNLFSEHNLIDTILHMMMGAVLFMVVGYYVPLIYFRYFDTTVYYKIYNPITVEKKRNEICSYVDAYIHREALVPIKGNSVRQLTLFRLDKNGLRERIRNFSTDMQAEEGEATVIAHWPIPCDIPLGTYFFEGTVSYRVRDIEKYTRFYTENFDIIASSSARINGYHQ